MQENYNKLFFPLDEVLDYEDPTTAPQLDIGIGDSDFVLEFGQETQS